MRDPSSAARSTAAALLRAHIVQIECVGRGSDPAEGWEEVTYLCSALLERSGLRPDVATLMLSQVAASAIRRLARKAQMDPVDVMQAIVIETELRDGD